MKTKSIQVTLATLGFSALALLVLVQGGCKIGGTTSCDFREGGLSKPEPRCQERSGLQGGEAFKATCNGLKAKAIDGACPQDGIVLGCDISGDGSVVDWYYSPKTEADVQSDCDSDHGTIVHP